MSYVPDANDTSEPTGDKSVKSAAAEFRRAKEKLERALIVPETGSLQELPSVAGRANKLLAFDGAGNPIALVGVDPGSAAALQLLLADPSISTNGDFMVAVLALLTGAQSTTQHEVNARTLSTFDFMNASQKADCLAGVFVDLRDPVQKAVNAALANGVTRIHAPGRAYGITGIAGADTKLDGILVPAGAINWAPEQQIIFEGDSSATVFKALNANTVLFRASRNASIFQNLTVDGGSLSDTWGIGLIPASLTQTTTQVSNSFCEIHNIVRRNCTEGLVFQPGPRVSGSDSGCFYFDIYGGVSESNTRHVWSKKGSTWATDNNRITRTNFYGQRLLRGNTGFHFDVGTEINLWGCHEELIASGVSPNATPVARYVAAACSQVNFYGGYSEACSASVIAFANNINSFGYNPASGSTTDWRSYANAWSDYVDDNRVLTPVVNSSGGGAQGASTSTGRLTKHGKLVYFTIQISVAKGTLAAGNITVAGLPFVADTSWTGASFQMIPVTHWSGITLGAGYVGLQAYISGATLNIRKLHSTGAAANLTVADCSDPIVFNVQGFYKAA